MTYLVLSTDVIVAALSSESWQDAAKLFDLCLCRRYQTVCTHEILHEYREVLARPRFGFNANNVEHLLDFLKFFSILADPLFDSLSRPICADKNDQIFYNCACCCDAFLITETKERFPKDQRILTPREFLTL